MTKKVWKWAHPYENSSWKRRVHPEVKSVKDALQSIIGFVSVVTFLFGIVYTLAYENKLLYEEKQRFYKECKQQYSKFDCDVKYRSTYE